LGKRVYAQWASLANCQHYRALLADPVASPYVPKVLAIARFDPGIYEVVKVFAPAASQGDGAAGA
jgi:hypothetical protein